jgi:hypothetical protein
VRASLLFAVVLAATVGGCAAVAGLDGYSKCTDDCEGGAAADVTVDSPAQPEAGADGRVRVEAGEASEPSEASGDDGGGSEAGVDASEAGSDGGSDAKLDAPVEAAPEGGCGPTNTTTNCGACGKACTPVGATADSCNGLSCTYTCSTGHSDCNASTAPDTDGCECATPGCCAAGCQTVHPDGVGQSFYDCNADGTYTEVTATEACTAFALSAGGTAADCSGGWTCKGSATTTVCYSTDTGNTCADYCWLYEGTAPDGGVGAGLVSDCSCPGAIVASWK